jgi:hypothetical protein
MEDKKFGIKIQSTVLDKPPVFIIGHWRTGTTYLHQMLHLDEQFTAPTMLQTSIPDHFLFSSKYYLPIMRKALPKNRPMDNVALIPEAPQEDEFALIRMGSVSPLEKLFFFSGHEYFLTDYREYIPSGEELKVWKTNLLKFYKKITLQTGKQIVSKNPYHTMRISLLADMFPGARFIYIYRNPLEVIPSTCRMWNIIAGSDNLKDSWYSPEAENVADVYRLFHHHAGQEMKKLFAHQVTVVTFEALERDPVQEIRKIYRALNLEYTENYEKNLQLFLSSVKDYTKNRHQLSSEDTEMISRKLGPTFPEYDVTPHM